MLINKIIKLFTVCLLFVSIFSVNVKGVFAGKDFDFVINDKEVTAVYNFKDNQLVYLSEQSSDKANEYFEKLGIEIGSEYNADDEKNYVTLILKNNVSLNYINEECKLIEAEIPLLIKKDPLLTENPTLFFTGDYDNCDDVEIVGIFCRDSLCIENVNLSFFEELKSHSYLKNLDGDEQNFIAIECGGTYGSYLSIANSGISMFGSTFITAEKYEVYFNNVIMKSTIMYPIRDNNITTYFDYYDCDSKLIEAYSVELSNSNIVTTINIPDIDPNRIPNPTDEMSNYVEESAIDVVKLRIEGGSKLTINEPNNNYANGIKAAYVSLSYGSLAIKGCINSIYYYFPDELLGEEDFSAGIHFFNGDFELESLLTNICIQDYEIEPVFAINETDDSSWHFDYMKVTGTDEDYKRLQTQVGSESKDYIKGFRSLDFDKVTLFHNQSYYSEFSGCHYLKYSTNAPQAEKDYNIDFDLSNDDHVKQLVETAKGIGIFSTVKPPAPASLALKTHGHTKIYYTDGKTEGDGYDFSGLNVSYNSDNQLFTINVTSNYTFIKSAEDNFASFIDVNGAGLKIAGNKTLSFEVTYPTAIQEMINSTRCIESDSSYVLDVSGNNSEKLKFVVKDKTDTSKKRTYSPVITSLFFIPNPSNSNNIQGKKLQFEMDNVDINSTGAIYLINSGGWANTVINNSNIIYKYTDPNFSDDKGYFCVSPILLSSGLIITNSNIELTGDKSLNQKGIMDHASGMIEGGIIVNGNLTIENCNGDKEICIKDFYVGIGSFGNIEISSSNIDVEGHHGGIGAYNKLSIAHSDEDYIRIKSNEKEEIEPNFTIEGGKYPAVFAFGSFSISTDSEHTIFAYDTNNNKEEFNISNLHTYRYIDINGDAKEEKEEQEESKEHQSDSHYVIPKTGIR